MPDIQKYSLGQPVPYSPHAVVSNIPTMEDVCAYEEKDPRVVLAMQQGYPRFVRHHWVQALTKAVLESLNLDITGKLNISLEDENTFFKPNE